MNQRSNHTFAQSRQNFFRLPQMAVIFHDIDDVTDFPSFFKQFPMSLALSNGFYENFPIDSFLSVLNHWSPHNRQNFFSVFFRDIRKVCEFNDLVMELFRVSSTSQLLSLLQTRLVTFYSAKRSLFLMYDSLADELIVRHERVNVRRAVRPGVFQRALVSQSVVEPSIDDADVSDWDRLLFHPNRDVLILPILSIHSQFQVDGLLILFDRFDSSKHEDVFSLSAVGRAVAHIAPALRNLEEQAERRAVLSAAVDVFTELCQSIDLDSLIQRIRESFIRFFHCEGVEVFRVHWKRQCYTNARYPVTDHPLSLGIVGRCITTGTSINQRKPQFSEHYNEAVDHFDVSRFSSSLMVAPVSAPSASPRWCLGNICRPLFANLEHARAVAKATISCARSKRRRDEARTLISAVMSLKAPIDLDSAVTVIQNLLPATATLGISRFCATITSAASS
jgi:hypothetical protein